MATILPKSQEWFDFNPSVVIGIHTVKLVSTSDVFRVPTLAEAHASASVKQLERTGDPTVTVTASDADGDGGYETITVAGTVGAEVVIASLHTSANFAEDEDE